MIGCRINEFVAHSTAVNCLSIGSHSNQVLATGGEDCKVNIWRIGSPVNVWTLTQKSPIECVCFDRSEQNVISGALSGAIKVFDLNEGQLVRSLRGHNVNAGALHYHPMGEFIVSGSTDSSVKVWDVRKRSCIQTIPGHTKDITCVRFSPDGRWVASASKEGKLQFFDLVACKQLSSIDLPHTAHITQFEFNPFQFVMAAASANRTVKMFAMDSMECIGSTNPESVPIKSIAFSRDGDHICAATNDTLKVWDWDSAPAQLVSNTTVGWDKLQHITVSENNQITGACRSSNFVSTWSLDMPIGENDKESKEEKHNDEHDSEDDWAAEPQIADAVPSTGRPALPDGLGPVDKALAGRPMEEEEANDGPDEDCDSLDGADVEGATSSLDMITSLGASFWAKYREQQEVLVNNVADNNNKEEKPPSCCTPRLPVEQLDDPPASVKVTVTPVKAPSKEVVNRESLHSAERKKSPRYVPSQHSREDRDQTGASSHYNGAKDVNRDINAFVVGNKQPSTSSSPYITSNDDERPGSRHQSHSAALSTFGIKHSNTPVKAKIDSYDAVNINSAAVAGGGCHDNRVEMLEKCSRDSSPVLDILNGRIEMLTALKNDWSAGHIAEVITQLYALQETSLLEDNPKLLMIIADFLLTTDLLRCSTSKGSQSAQTTGSGLTLDTCVQLLPLLQTLMGNGHETNLSSSVYVAKSALHTVGVLCDAFGDLVRSTRSIMVIETNAQVDISREERLRKCNLCYNSFVRSKGRLDALKYSFPKLDYLIKSLEGKLENVVKPAPLGAAR